MYKVFIREPTTLYPGLVVITERSHFLSLPHVFSKTVQNTHSQQLKPQSAGPHQCALFPYPDKWDLWFCPHNRPCPFLLPLLCLPLFLIFFYQILVPCTSLKKSHESPDIRINLPFFLLRLLDVFP